MPLCKKCGTKMIEISRERVLVEADYEDMTEGQMADYMGEEMSGEYDNWGMTEILYKCPKCKEILIIGEM